MSASPPSLPPSIAKTILQRWQARVTSIPTSTKQESDWLAELDGFRLLVEEKTKLDDPAMLAARRARLANEDIFESVTSLRPNNRLSAIARKAAGQLGSTAADVPHNARILWMTAVGVQSHAKLEQMVATLYGSTLVFELDDGVMGPCYFFYDSAFFRLRAHLDGAIVAAVRGRDLTLHLCLNPHAPGHARLANSPFARHFPALVDPLREEADELAYIADGDLDRKDSDAVLAFVAEKYRLRMAQHIDLMQVSGTMAFTLPRDRVPTDGEAY